MTGERITNDDLPKGWIAADAVDCVHFCLVAMRQAAGYEFFYDPLLATMMPEAVHGRIAKLKKTSLAARICLLVSYRPLAREL